MGVLAGCWAKVLSGTSPQQSAATAGTAFQELDLIQPLTFVKDFGQGINTPDDEECSAKRGFAVSLR
jgi:hypothetical protein